MDVYEVVKGPEHGIVKNAWAFDSHQSEPKLQKIPSAF